ncbi:hypothetical protein E3N88_21970 [Mikania micrantha]|uniref:ARID domain-containing protein n=1 Tax=Mikania micrantha TaxID=192012 RepID=A0A5N6NA69_9ASTR|nr:hypothetical protein E3N88_21970 [Mikania micrantha]
MDGISKTTKNLKDNLDQGDQRGLSEDDQSDHRNSSMESLCITVEKIQIEKKEEMGKKTGPVDAKKFRNHINRRNGRRSFKYHSCTYCVRPGFEVTFEGTMCVIAKPYMVFVEHNVKEDEKASKEYVTEARNSNIKWNDVDHLDNISKMWDHFEQMEIKDQPELIKKEKGKGNELEQTLEIERITTLEEMKIFLDLLDSVNINQWNKWTLRNKFEEMVKCVHINGGKEKVNNNNFWVLLAGDMGLDSWKGYKLMFIYNEYLDLMEWFYKNVKERKKQHGIYIFEAGEGSSKEQHKGKVRPREESNLPYKKKKIQAIRDWPPGCGPAI